VTFFSNGESIGTGTLSAGAANLNVNSLPVGKTTLTASYSSDTNFTSASSNSVAVTVDTAPTTTSLKVSPTSSTFGAQMTLTATVTGRSGLAAPTGVAKFLNGATTIGSANLGDGLATLQTTTLPIGSGSLTAAYQGSSIYASSTSQPVTITVTDPANPTPTVSSTSPAYTHAGSGAFELTVNGSGFMPASTIKWGTAALSTAFVNSAQLKASVPASYVTSEGSSSITVVNLAPGGGVSNAFTFEVDSANASGATPSFTNPTAVVTAGTPATYAVAMPSNVTSAAVNCLNLPAGAACSYSASHGSLTITTSAITPKGTYQITTVFTESLSGGSAGYVLLPFLLIPIYQIRKKSRGKVLLCLALLSILAGSTLFTLTGCGSNTRAPSQPTQPTQQVTSSALVTLTIQ
jgi:hypothetical protein